MESKCGRFELERRLGSTYISQMIRHLFKPRPTRSSPLSEFIRTASSAEKKRVYGDVLKKATERQNQLVKGVPHGE
jgi:hypothetical protein